MNQRGKKGWERRWAEAGASRRVGGLVPSVTYEDPITGRLLDFSFMSGADRHITDAALCLQTDINVLCVNARFIPCSVEFLNGRNISDKY